jgi:uncharacterized small protein (DUF1192 family)
MARNRTEYMREYRARKSRALITASVAGIETGIAASHAAQERIAELEAEVQRLKQDLAKRPYPEMAASQGRTRYTATHTATNHHFGAPRPAPKPGKH